MRGKGPWLSIKSIFAPTEVAATLVLLGMVVAFAVVWRVGHRPGPAAHVAPMPTAQITSASPQLAASASPQQSPVPQLASGNGLGSIIRAAGTTGRARPGVSLTPAPAPTPTPTDTPTPTPTPTPTDTATPTPTPTPTPTDTPTPSPSPSP
jgi:hypothetical protein